MPDGKRSPDGWAGVQGMKTMAERESAREQERNQARERERERAREQIRTRRVEHRRNGPFYALIAIAGVLATSVERLTGWPRGVGHGPWNWNDITIVNGLIFVLLNMFALWVATLFLGPLVAEIVILFDRRSRAPR
jgi:membrane glycosyltransferase